MYEQFFVPIDHSIDVDGIEWELVRNYSCRCVLVDGFPDAVRDDEIVHKILEGYFAEILQTLLKLDLRLSTLAQLSIPAQIVHLL